MKNCLKGKSVERKKKLAAFEEHNEVQLHYCKVYYLQYVQEEDDRRRETEYSTIMQCKLAQKADQEAEARKGMPKQQMAKPDTLLPSELTKDASQLVYMKWLDQWTTYFRASHIK